MSRVAYIAEIDPREVAALGYLAGMLQSQGIQQGAVLAAILDRIQLVEVPDDFTGVASEESEATTDEAEQETSLSLVPDVDEDDGEVLPENSFEPHGGELPAIDPTTDPTAPENLGIELNLPNPYGPPPVTQFANQEDFGAGPPPRQS